MEESIEIVQTDKWINRKLLNKSDIEKAWKEFDKVRGEDLYCKDIQGRILLITGGVSSPLLPLVKFVELIDIRKSTEKESAEVKMPFPEFLALEPIIIDIEEEKKFRE